MYAGGWGAFTGFKKTIFVLKNLLTVFFFWFNRIGKAEYNRYLGHEVKETDCGFPCIQSHDKNR